MMRGFVTIYLVLAVLGAVMVGGLGIQTWRLGAAQEELGAEKAGKALAMARIETLSLEKKAAEASLADRDKAHEAIRRLRIQTRRQLKEVEREPEVAASLDCPVPEPVRRLLRDHRRGHGQPGAPEAATDAPEALPPPGGRPGHSS